MTVSSGMSPERLCESGIVTENYFDEGVAARYDETIGSWGDPEVIESAVGFLATLAGGGAALELGIGTGRIALPLSARGVRVHGIDLSEAVRCLDGRTDHGHSFATEDVIEAAAELGVAIVDQEAGRSLAIIERHPQVASCWVTRAPVGLGVQATNSIRRNGVNQVEEHEDLELLRALRSEQEHDQLKQATKRQIDERPNHARPPELGEGEAIEQPASPAINQRSEFSDPTRRGLARN
jgi:hypothetical protein